MHSCPFEHTHTSQSILFTFKHVFCIYHRKQIIRHSRGFASQVFQHQETIFDCQGGRGRSCGNGKASRCGSGGAFFYFIPLIFLRSRVHWRSRETNLRFEGQSGRRNEVVARRFRHRKIRISLAFLCSFLIRTRGRDTVDISKGKILKTFSLFATSSCCYAFGRANGANGRTEWCGSCLNCFERGKRRRYARAREKEKKI